MTPIDVVQNIHLAVDFELTVGEIIDKYGPPEAMFAGIAGVDRRYVAVNLYYPTQGIQVRAHILDETGPVLEPATKVYTVLYTVPAESLDSWLASWEFERHIQPWPGYGALDSVCDLHQ